MISRLRHSRHATPPRPRPNQFSPSLDFVSQPGFKLHFMLSNLGTKGSLPVELNLVFPIKNKASDVVGFSVGRHEELTPKQKTLWQLRSETPARQRQPRVSAEAGAQSISRSGVGSRVPPRPRPRPSHGFQATL